jgi:hypothetical protein
LCPYFLDLPISSSWPLILSVANHGNGRVSHHLFLPQVLPGENPGSCNPSQPDLKGPPWIAGANAFPSWWRLRRRHGWHLRLLWELCFVAVHIVGTSRGNPAKLFRSRILPWITPSSNYIYIISRSCELLRQGMPKNSRTFEPLPEVKIGYPTGESWVSPHSNSTLGSTIRTSAGQLDTV